MQLCGCRQNVHSHIPDILTHTVRGGRAVYFKRKGIKKLLTPWTSENETVQGSPSQVGTHAVLPWFPRTTVTAPKEAKINASGYCREEELFAYKPMRHPRISISQLFSMHTP